MTKNIMMILAFAMISTPALAAQSPCEIVARHEAAAKIRKTHQFKSYPHPYLYGIFSSASGENEYKVTVSFGDASGSDTAEDATCTVYTVGTAQVCSVTDVACSVN